MLQNIITKINYINKINNNNNLQINGISQLFDNVDNTITWCNDKNLIRLNDINNKTIIVSENLPKDANNSNNYIVVDKPRVEFKKLLDILYPDDVNNEPVLGQNVVIGSHVTMGQNVKIGHNSVILDNTIIGSNVTIGCNNTIGGIGFGYEKDEFGEYQLIKHIGNVVINDGVEIGNNTCIDRGVIGSTIIGENCKIDNLVHIAHGVNIGKNSLIIANSMIAGSVTIGENVWVAPSTSIINGINIGNNSMTGIGSLVIKEIKDGELHIGSPAKKYKDL
jgi:UDP-3-O-[3-hydroxymyristoyl] glucosamine N-acyltransferase